MGFYEKEALNNEFKRVLGTATQELGIQSIVNDIKKILTEEEIKQLIDYLNGTK